jgi:hypothetical protein
MMSLIPLLAGTSTVLTTYHSANAALPAIPAGIKQCAVSV